MPATFSIFRKLVVVALPNQNIQNAEAIVPPVHFCHKQILNSFHIKLLFTFTSLSSDNHNFHYTSFCFALKSIRKQYFIAIAIFLMRIKPISRIEIHNILP